MTPITKTGTAAMVEEQLRILDGKVDRLTAMLDRVEQKLATNTARPSAAKATAQAVEPADDATLDGERGDPIVKWDPKYGWDGPSYAGSRFSECPADYLEVVAQAREASAAKKTDPQKADWDRQEAAVARGWARRIRAKLLAEAKDWSANAEQDDLGF